MCREHLQLPADGDAAQGNGLTCFYGGEADLVFNGGTQPELSASKFQLKRLPGGGEAFCGTGSWTATYSVLAPSPVWVDWP